MWRNIWFSVLLGITGVTDLRAVDADVAVGAGAGPASGNARADPRGNDVNPEVGGTLLFNAAFDFLRWGKAAFGLEIPVAVHGSRSADILAQGGYAGLYRERLAAVLTPGIRVRIAPGESHISPWLSFGTGVAVIHRSGNDFLGSQPAASQTGSSRVLALAPAAGADIRLVRRWFARVEARNYLYQTPATGFVSSFVYWNRWNHDLVVAGSIGLRFP